MARRSLTLFFPLVLALSLPWRPAVADEANRNFMPFGERAAFLGNAGITSQLGEALFYNPANLARIGHPNLSVSANLYGRFRLKADPLLVIEGEPQPFEASGFISNPSSLVSTMRIGSWSLAYGVLIPEAFKYKNRVTFESANLHATLLQETDQESLWFGAGIAHEIARGLSAGVSAFAVKESAQDLLFVHSEVRTDPPSVSEFTSSTDLSVWNLSVIAGLFWQAHPRLGLGLRAHVPPIKLTGGADIYQATLTASAGMDAMLESEFEDVEVSAPLPWDLGVGASFWLARRLELVLDVNLQLPATLTEVDDPRVGKTEVELDLAPRAGVGAEWEFLTRWWLRLGALYNRSAFPEPKVIGDEPSEDFYGVTSGIAWQKDRTHTAVGGFFLYSPTSLLVEGSDPVEKSDASTLFYGLLLTVSYRL